MPPDLKCAPGSPTACKVEDMKVTGYSAGAVVKVTGGNKVKKSTEADSCPTGWKIWSPRNKNDWTIVYNALGQNVKYYPKKPDLIVDVTRSSDGCSGCKNHAMNSGVSAQSSWKTKDGSDWWLRDTKYSQPSGNYKANCYMEVKDVNPNAVTFDDKDCTMDSTDYLCQPMNCSSAQYVKDNKCLACPSGSICDGTHAQTTCSSVRYARDNESLVCPSGCTCVPSSRTIMHTQIYEITNSFAHSLTSADRPGVRS